MTETLRSETVYTRLGRIAEMARKHPERAFSSIHHVIDEALLKAAYEATRKDGAVGVDGETSAAFGATLDERLRRLETLFTRGEYRAPAVRRVHIPKGDGRKTRPIGIPTFEDKVLQRAVTMVVSAIYEQDFLPCSYGFRAGRSAHDALDALRKALMQMKSGVVVELDIERYFDTLDHRALRSFLDRRVTDGVIRRAIDKWLAAGVLEEGRLHYPDEGTPQGGVISPLLANIYLHEVLDAWFERDVKPRLRGRGILVRYADDAVLVFERMDDAQRVMEVLPKRFARFGLRLHPEKTRLLPFGQPAPERDDDDGATPGSFDFLGFTHHWAKSLRGQWVVKRRTATDRLSRALRRISVWCRDNRHEPIAKQRDALAAKLHGHYGYYGITGNYHALARFHHEVERVWHTWLCRRSWATHTSWEWFKRLLQRLPLPQPVAVHSVLRRTAKA
jgi:RNA-directed DNA polymerase